MSRRKTREVAMKLLFQMGINKESYEDVIDILKENDEIRREEIETLIREKDPEDICLKDVDMDYVKKVLKGIQENKEAIDSQIEKYLVKWKINRLSKIDLSILRICTYEFLYEAEIPNSVSINEAIEFAKKYSEDKSSAFINGVLGNMMKNL